MNDDGFGSFLFFWGVVAFLIFGSALFGSTKENTRRAIRDWQRMLSPKPKAPPPPLASHERATLLMTHAEIHEHLEDKKN